MHQNAHPHMEQVCIYTVFLNITTNIRHVLVRMKEWYICFVWRSTNQPIKWPENMHELYNKGNELFSSNHDPPCFHFSSWGHSWFYPWRFHCVREHRGGHFNSGKLSSIFQGLKLDKNLKVYFVSPRERPWRHDSTYSWGRS